MCLYDSIAVPIAVPSLLCLRVPETAAAERGTGIKSR